MTRAPSDFPPASASAQYLRLGHYISWLEEVLGLLREERDPTSKEQLDLVIMDQQESGECASV